MMIVHAAKYQFYVAGIIDILLHEPKGLGCLPSTVTNGQLALIVGKYLEQHPEEHHLDAWLQVGWAVTNAFPCEK
jgi:hypothetical protein